MTELAGWENFYVIVGSSAGALIGLQFVVITLIADRATGRGQAQAGGAFATPTIVHFGMVLFLAGILTMPWRGSSVVEVCWGALGVAGIVYELITIRRMRLQTIYIPVFEDWIFHAVFPSAAYVTLAASAYAAREHARGATFAIAAAALLLLLVGIHNAWDAVTYHLFHVGRPRDDTGPDH